MMPRSVIVTGGIALLAAMLWRSMFAIDESEVALLTRFGQVQAAELGPGLHLKSPFVEVHKFDRRLITRLYSGESFLSQDQQPLNVDFYLRWRLIDPGRYLAATGGDEDTTATKLAEMVRARIRVALASAPLTADIVGSNPAAGALHSEALRAGAEQLGVDLVDVQLERIALPDAVANTVYQRMQQSLAAQAQQLRTQGTAEADRIRADAERRRAEILADGTREAQRVRGEADAAAAAAYARAYGANPEFAAFSRTLQAYKSSLGRDGDILVISPDGEFFKYLHSANGR
jgi:membrane protease subunit HflC